MNLLWFYSTIYGSIWSYHFAIIKYDIDKTVALHMLNLIKPYLSP